MTQPSVAALRRVLDKTAQRVTDAQTAIQDQAVTQAQSGTQQPATPSEAG